MLIYISSYRANRESREFDRKILKSTKWRDRKNPLW